MARIALYCGARFGEEPIFAEESMRLASLIAKAGFGVVYGGSKSGLMGAIASAAVDDGGEVIGVEPGFLVDAEEQHDGISELVVVETVSERRTRMIELSDAYVALPGGIGTLDEITEVLQLAKLDRLGNKPIAVLNAKGCYDSFENLLRDMKRNGFVNEYEYSRIAFLGTADEVFAYLAERL